MKRATVNLGSRMELVKLLGNAFRKITPPRRVAELEKRVAIAVSHDLHLAESPLGPNEIEEVLLLTTAAVMTLGDADCPTSRVAYTLANILALEVLRLTQKLDHVLAGRPLDEFAAREHKANRLARVLIEESADQEDDDFAPSAL